MRKIKKQSKLKWWQVRSTDFALFLYVLIFHRFLMLSIWIVGATFSDGQDVEMSYVLDLPIAGNHPINMLYIILMLIWGYFIVCFFTAMRERCYSTGKLISIFLVLLLMLGLASQRFAALFLTLDIHF